MPPFTGVPTHAQQVALAICPKVAGICSMLGSGYIVYDILLGRKRKRNPKTTNTYHRVLVGLSLCDMMMSFGFFTSTWPMPKDTPNVWGAMGNTQTCELIGFLETAGTSAVLYSGSLSIYYLLKIRQGWSDSQIRRVEVWLHLVPLVFGLSTMIAGLPLNLYNSGIFDCWIAPYPQNCQESWRRSDDNNDYVECTRGDNASIYIWAFDLIPKWSTVLLITWNMYLTWRAVNSQEKRTQRYSLKAKATATTKQPMPRNSISREISMMDRAAQGTASGRMTSTTTCHDATDQAILHHHPPLSLSQRMARQCYLYVGALYITYIPVAMTRLTQLLTGHSYYAMILTIAITIPLQGCWNVLVYLRPRYLYNLEQRQRQKQQQLRQGRLRPGEDDDDENNEHSGGSSGQLAAGFFSAWNMKASIEAFSQAVRDGELDEEEESKTEQVNEDDAIVEEQEEDEDAGSTAGDKVTALLDRRTANINVSKKSGF